MAGELIICMDILNYSNSFFKIPRNSKRTVDFESDLKKARRKIEMFVEASRASGYEIIGFIDKSISTEETMDKWYSRRRKEMECGTKDCITNMSLILGSIFQSLGVTVHFSTVDCDDTIAAFAHHHNGSVLSRDCDFFRYYVDRVGDRPYQVYFDFSVSSGELTLNPHGGPGRNRPRASPRQILRSLPETCTTTFFLDNVPPFLSGGTSGDFMYQRGCGSNLTQEPNPHLQARGLRQAMYERKGYGPVLEIIAHWDQEPTFTEDEVFPDGELDRLLDSPREAHQHIFPASERTPESSVAKWKNHIFCQKCVIAELCAWSSKTGEGFLDILDTLK